MVEKSTIYFDEAGNSGHDLLNTAQPIYILCSTDIEDEQAKSILSKYFSDINNLHFKRRRRTSKGKQEITNFIKSELSKLNPYIKSVVYHKEYMIICQILNYLVEPQLYQDGIDYYDSGMNIAHANMMYAILPVFCGRGITRRLYKAFIQMFKCKSKDTIEQFYHILEMMRVSCINKNYEKDINILLRSITDIQETLSVVNKYTLDPAIHALIELCEIWNDKYNDGFNIIHDRSNTVYSQKDLLDFLVNIETESTRVGYGEFKTTYPLRISSFEFVDSRNSFGIKLCDIVASSLYYYHLNPTDELSLNIKDYIENWNLTDQIWPSNNVEPDNRRKKTEGDINATDFLTEQIFKSMKKINRDE